MAITLDGNNLTTTGVINSGTAVASTSGTSIDFTGIPSGVKRVTVLFNGVSTNGSSFLQVQIGAGSVTTTGYLSASSAQGAANQVLSGTSTTGFALYNNGGTNFFTGVITVASVGSNTWVSSHALGITNSGYSLTGGGTVTLSGTLDRVRVTTVNGTDTFDAGSINILWE